MVFNNVTDTLRLWCEQLCRSELAPCAASRACSAPVSLRFRTAKDLAFWLCTLTDADFPEFDAYRSALRALLPVKLAPPLGHEPNPVEQYQIQKVESAFLDLIDTLKPDCPQPALPYCRILPEAEAVSVKKRLMEKWGCRENEYWYPLAETEIPAEDLFFISASILEDYQDALCELLRLPERHMFSLEESWFQHPNCFETDDLEGYGGIERFYTAKDYSWLIYFSHENTVSFAGSLVPAAKELLRNEQPHWNSMEDCW